VDTPGFNYTERSDTEILEEIASWTSSTYEDGRLLNGIIYLHRISDPRMEGSALKNLHMFRSLCGPDALHNVLLTTTHWSQVTRENGERREKELLETVEFWGTLKAHGAMPA
jgi:hypothetical protein